MKTKHIIVTGGSRGIGRGIVEHLIDHGYGISFLYKSNEEAADDLISKMSGRGEIKKYKCDVRNFQEVKTIINDIILEWGGLDGLVNNSGITSDKVLLMMQEENWKSVIDTNLNGYFNVTRATINHFLKQKKGAIVNISSVAGLVGMYGQTNYCAAKSGIIGFTKSLAVETAKYGVKVNAIAPGYIDTDMTKDISVKKKDELYARIPMGRIGVVEDIAPLVRFLLSDESNYITGQVIAVDGGITA